MKLGLDPRLPIQGGQDYGKQLYTRLYDIFRSHAAAVNAVDAAADAAQETANSADAKATQALEATEALGTAALANITTSATDTTPGRVLKVGDFGVGLSGAGQIIIDNVNRIDVPTGLYRVLNTTTGTLPANSGSHYGTLIVEAYSLISGTESFCQTFTRAFSSPQRWFRYYAFNLISGSPGWSPWVELYHSGNLVLNPWAVKVIGEPFPLDPNAPTPPTNDPSFRYIALIAGLTGAGGYNQGVLTSETVTGSDPTITATAVVSLAGSPFNGKTIDLIGTSRAFIRPGPAPAAIVNSQNLAHSHGIGHGNITASGPYRAADMGQTGTILQSNSSGGSESAPRHIARVFYMRIL